MKGGAEPKVQSLRGARCGEAKRVAWLFACLLLASLFLFVVIQFSPVVSAVRNTSNPDSARVNIPIADYSNFSHSSPKEHADLMARSNCASCHRRSDGSLEPKFPLHKDCTGCHLVQFTAGNNSSAVNPICTICHKPEGLNSSNAPLKSFPRLMSFAAEFDHGQHLKGIESARLGNGCAACHSPTNRGVAETIPARLNVPESRRATPLHVAPVTGLVLTPRLQLLLAHTR